MDMKIVLKRLLISLIWILPISIVEVCLIYVWLYSGSGMIGVVVFGFTIIFLPSSIATLDWITLGKIKFLRFWE